MTCLLDVNGLIAFINPAHVGHDAAHRWFEAEGRTAWATCPSAENGVIRIVGHPEYPNNPGSSASVAAIMAQLRALPGHVFWPDDISLVHRHHVDAEQVLTSAQVTDTYLLALAVAHPGKLATFDRHLSVQAVKGGQAALQLIGDQIRIARSVRKAQRMAPPDPGFPDHEKGSPSRAASDGMRRPAGSAGDDAASARCRIPRSATCCPRPGG